MRVPGQRVGHVMPALGVLAHIEAVAARDPYFVVRGCHDGTYVLGEILGVRDPPAAVLPLELIRPVGELLGAYHLAAGGPGVGRIDHEDAAKAGAPREYAIEARPIRLAGHCMRRDT